MRPLSLGAASEPRQHSDSHKEKEIQYWLSVLFLQKSHRPVCFILLQMASWKNKTKTKLNLVQNRISWMVNKGTYWRKSSVLKRHTSNCMVCVVFLGGRQQHESKTSWLWKFLLILCCFTVINIFTYVSMSYRRVYFIYSRYGLQNTFFGCYKWRALKRWPFFREHNPLCAHLPNRIPSLRRVCVCASVQICNGRNRIAFWSNRLKTAWPILATLLYFRVKIEVYIERMKLRLGPG